MLIFLNRKNSKTDIMRIFSFQFIFFFTCYNLGMAQTSSINVEAPVDDDEYQRILEYYSYDSTITSDPIFYGEWPWRSPHTLYKVSYRSAREQRVPAYLAIPKKKKNKKLPVIVLMHGWNLFWGKNEDWIQQLIPMLTAQGYAVLAPDHFLFGERKVEGGFDSHDNWGTYYCRDWMGQSIVDLRRGIDYLLTRSDIDPEKIGVVGGSLGGWIGSILVAVESRIKTAVLIVPATEFVTGQTAPARIVNTSNFVSRYNDFSMLMLIAKKDNDIRNLRAKRFFEIAPIEKMWIEYDQPHAMNPNVYIEDILVWLDEQL